MQALTTNKESIIQKFEKLISISDAEPNNWRIGIGSLQRASLLNVGDEIVYQKSPIDEATENCEIITSRLKLSKR